jgi:hypothetical protein
MKEYNVCEATCGCPFGKKDGTPQVCYAAEVCSGFTGKEKIKKERKMKRKINLRKWDGSDAELLDTMDESIGAFQIALAADGISFSDERDVRRLFLEAFSRNDIQERILITAEDLLAEDRDAAMAGGRK